MNLDSSILTRRKEFSSNRLKELKLKIKKIDKLVKDRTNLCIYVTGSYGRHEATKYSDLDLFFLNDGKSNNNKLSKLNKTLVDAEIIKQTSKMNFGEFSNDGQYLEVHYIEDILDALGCPDDDYKNYFTARMLLLLESKPIYNSKFYNYLLKEIILSYYRDYHDHDKDFRPIFLVNDILRFWKTLCLNYEHKRNRATENKLKKNQMHLKNLKLKFSRMIICFATIIILIRQKNVVTPDELLKILRLTPLERIYKACGNNVKLKKQYEAILKDYTWFLNMTNKPQNEVIQWIAKRSNRDRAFERGRKFGFKLFGLLNEIADQSDLRYIII